MYVIKLTVVKITFTITVEPRAIWQGIVEQLETLTYSTSYRDPEGI